MIKFISIICIITRRLPQLVPHGRLLQSPWKIPCSPKRRQFGCFLVFLHFQVLSPCRTIVDGGINSHKFFPPLWRPEKYCNMLLFPLVNWHFPENTHQINWGIHSGLCPANIQHSTCRFISRTDGRGNRMQFVWTWLTGSNLITDMFYVRGFFFYPMNLFILEGRLSGNMAFIRK